MHMLFIYENVKKITRSLQPKNTTTLEFSLIHIYLIKH